MGGYGDPFYSSFTILFHLSRKTQDARPKPRRVLALNRAGCSPSTVQAEGPVSASLKEAAVRSPKAKPSQGRTANP